MFVKSNTDPDMSEAAKQVVRDRDAFIESRMSDTTERIARMDAMGVDMQVLSSSLVQQCTYWAEPQESLRAGAHAQRAHGGGGRRQSAAA